MPGRHRPPRPKIPFFAVAAALVVIAGVVVAGAATHDGQRDPGRGPADGATPGITPSPTNATGVASGGPGSTTPTPSATTAGPKKALLIHGTGDVSLDPSYIPAFRSNGYAYAWSGLGGLFRKDDLTVVNLECPATDITAPIPKTFNFRCDPAALPIAKRYGVDVANQSNNHAYDQGPSGLLDSLKEIRRAGLAPVGAGENQDAALQPAFFEINGWKIAVLGFDEVLDPLNEVAGADKPGTAAGHDFGLMVRAVRAAAADSDLVVVMIHWGVELDTQPRSYQVDEGHRLIDAGADVIFGGHSHRLQPLSMYHGRPIFWSLGNFVWPHFSVQGSTTAVAEVTVGAQGEFRARLLPAYIAASGHPVLR